MRFDGLGTAASLLALVACLTACGGSGGAEAVVGGPDGGDDGGSVQAPDGGGVAPDAGPGSLVSLAVAPLPLQPAFSPDVHDYYVRCVATT